MRTKTIISRPCDFCNTLYEAEERYLNRGQGKYCSRSCGSAARIGNRPQPPAPNVECAYCSKPFYKNLSKQRCSRSGLFFCCRDHKDKAQRIGGIKEIQPPHYGVVEGIHSYRRIAFEAYPHECDTCGWDDPKEILVVHHIDRDRTNDSVENLKILCPTHHEAEHYLSQSGKWTNHIFS